MSSAFILSLPRSRGPNHARVNLSVSCDTCFCVVRLSKVIFVACHMPQMTRLSSRDALDFYDEPTMQAPGLHLGMPSCGQRSLREYVCYFFHLFHLSLLPRKPFSLLSFLPRIPRQPDITVSVCPFSFSFLRLLCTSRRVELDLIKTTPALILQRQVHLGDDFPLSLVVSFSF